MRPALAALAALVAALLAGCGDSPARISAATTKNLVLTAGDLPSGYAAFAQGPTSSLDVQGTLRANLQRFGRRGGWVERLRRTRPVKRGALIVVSTVDVFRDSRGARADLRSYADGLSSPRLDVAGLGDDAVAARLLAPGGEKSFEVAWAFRNATASVTAIGNGITLADVVALARRQQAKLN